MASKAFSAAIANLKKSKNVETVLVGANFLDAGTHDVSIKTIDTSAIDEGKLGVTFIDEEGKEYTDRMFLMSSDGAELAYGLRAMLSALIPDKDALAAFLELVSEDDKTFEMFTGMRLRITLEPGKGVQARAQGDGSFAGYDVESNTKVTEDYATIKEVYDFCKANAMKRSFLRVVKSEATAKEDNVAAFKSAVAAKQQPGEFSTNG